MYWNGWWSFPMLAMWGFWILIVVLIVVLIWSLTNTQRHRPPSVGGESAEDILKKRYARGEIDRDEYHRRLEDLRK